MNCTLRKADDTPCAELLFQDDITLSESIYATRPMPSVQSIPYQRADEEELHTSFEEAISDRQLAIHGRLSRLSNPTLTVQNVESNTDALFPTSARNIALAKKSKKNMPAARKYTLILTCSAVMFVLLGFDMMGLLMLHLR